MSFGLLNEYRIHTTKVECKVQEAQSNLHNAKALLNDVILEMDGADSNGLKILARLINTAARALDEL